MCTLVNITVEQGLHASELFSLSGLGVEHLYFVFFLHYADLVSQYSQFLLLISVLLDKLSCLELLWLLLCWYCGLLICGRRGGSCARATASCTYSIACLFGLCRSTALGFSGRCWVRCSMGGLLLLKLLYLLLMLPQLIFKLFYALALLRGKLWADTYTLSALPLFGRVLHSFQEWTLVNSTQVCRHHIEVFELGDHCTINSNRVHDLWPASYVYWWITGTSANFWPVFALLWD